MSDETRRQELMERLARKIAEDPTLASLLKNPADTVAGLSALLGPTPVPDALGAQRTPRPIEQQWIVAALLDASDQALRASGTTTEDRTAIGEWKGELVEVCLLINEHHGSQTSIADIRLQAYFLAALEVGFMLGSSTESSGSAAKAISRIQSHRAKASGEARKKDADQGWKPHALELAIAARTLSPGLSQADLAAAIRDSWRLKIKKPAINTLIPFIRKAEEKDLPKAKRP